MNQDIILILYQILKIMVFWKKKTNLYLIVINYYIIKNINGVDYILITKKVSNNKILKQAYSLDGVLIDKAEDTNLLKISYIRNFGDYTLLIKNNKIIFIEHRIKLKAIKRPIYKDKLNIIENTIIGVIDV